MMKKRNFEDDIDFILRLWHPAGENQCVDADVAEAEDDVRAEEIGWPDWDWEARFWTKNRVAPVVASCIGGKTRNCFNDGGRIHIVLNDHGMRPGVMMMQLRLELPNAIYPDGRQRLMKPQETGIVLTREASECPTTAEVEAMLPYIKGEPFRYEDFTEAQLEDIRRPGVEAAVVALRAAGEAEAGAEAARQAAERAEGVTESMRETEQAVTDAEAEREKAEQIRQADEAARRQAEQERKTEFEGWHDTIESKADRTELSNLISEPADNALNDLDATLVTEALRKVPQALTPEEQAQVKANLAISKMELFCDLFTEACIVRNMYGYTIKEQYGYARITDGVFDSMLNGLPLTYEEAVRIYNAGPVLGSHSTASLQFCNNVEVRTNLPLKYMGGVTEANYAFVSCTNIEVINARGIKAYISTINSCGKLRRIISPVQMARNIANFQRCPCLEAVELVFTNTSPMTVSFADCPLLSLASFQYMIDNARNEAAVTITVHPDVYAKLTDAANTEWHALLALGAEKDIIFATV